ncbi:MAG: ribosome maturation factor RimM [Clostridiaceae bacterium]
MKEFLSIGQIINSHGIKGELKVYPLTDDIKRFRKLKIVYINGIERNVVWVKLQAKLVIMKIEGIDTIEDVDNYKDKYIDIDRTNAAKLKKGNYFIADIIGCKVFDSNDFYFGEIYDVIKTGSNDVYWVKGIKEVLVPALKDVVMEINIDEKKIIIKPLGDWYED